MLYVKYAKNPLKIFLLPCTPEAALQFGSVWTLFRAAFKSLPEPHFLPQL